MQQTDFINKVAVAIREKTLAKYGTTAGKCIETSDAITDILLSKGYHAEEKQVWVLYENFESCMEYCYEEHWLTKVLIKGYTYYVDATMDQFQWAFSKKLPEVYISRSLPKFYLVKKPGKVTLDKCGWNDWYNYGNYINNFEYYS